MLLEKNFLTETVSAPSRLKYAAASNVLTPTLTVKFLVSYIIPQSKASASFGDNLYCSPKY